MSVCRWQCAGPVSQGFIDFYYYSNQRWRSNLIPCPLTLIFLLLFSEIICLKAEHWYLSISKQPEACSLKVCRVSLLRPFHSPGILCFICTMQLTFCAWWWICVTLPRSEVLVIFTFLPPKEHKLEISAHAIGVNSPSVADFRLLSQHHSPWSWLEKLLWASFSPCQSEWSSAIIDTL